MSCEYNGAVHNSQLHTLYFTYSKAIRNELLKQLSGAVSCNIKAGSETHATQMRSHYQSNICTFPSLPTESKECQALKLLYPERYSKSYC